MQELSVMKLEKNLYVNLIFTNIRIKGKKARFVIYKEPTRCNFGQYFFINNCKYTLHVSDAFCAHHPEY